MREPRFVTREQVNAIHRLSLELHGGQDGVRNEHGLESAIALPRRVFHYGQGDLFDLAAGYAYHLAENQPFLDGNKRTAISTALVFLELNGVATSAVTNSRLHDAMIAIAEKRLDKAGLAALLRSQLSHENHPASLSIGPRPRRAPARRLRPGDRG